MREQYTLSDETRAVLTDHVIPIAAEMDVHTSFLYQILSGVGTDCFAKFRRLYAACVRAGVDVSPWDCSFHEIKTRHAANHPDSTPCQTLSEKIALDADTTSKMVDALKDGEIDMQERSRILLAIQKERDSLDVLEAVLSLSDTTDGIRQFARGAVANRNGKQ